MTKAAVLNKGNFNMLAIANPRFSPYGVAAKETLTKLTMWNSIQEKLTKGENVTQTYQLVATEKADLAFIALSQVMRDGKVTDGFMVAGAARDASSPSGRARCCCPTRKIRQRRRRFLLF